MKAIYRTFAVFVLWLSAVCQAAEIKVTGPDRQNPGMPVFFNTTGVKQSDAYDLFIVPASGDFFVLFDKDGAPVGVYSNMTPGVYTAVLVAHSEGKILKSLHAVTIGTPKPPEPTPPEPEPPVPVPPGPSGFRVLILEETAERAKLPKAQLSALLSTKAREYLNTKTPKGADGKTPEWRMLDDDHTDTSFLAENWKLAVERARKESAGKLPWIIVSDGAKGESRAFPQTEAELLELLRKYGG